MDADAARETRDRPLLPVGRAVRGSLGAREPVGGQRRSIRVDLRDHLVRPQRPTVPEDLWGTIEELGLGDDLHLHPEELPFGRRRLVAAARTVAARPSLLLLDEPAAGLNEVESRHLGDLIRRLAHKSTLAVLMIEHDVALVSSVCDRVVVMDFGKVIAQGSPADVTSNELVIAAYLGEPDPALDDRARSDRS